MYHISLVFRIILFRKCTKLLLKLFLNVSILYYFLKLYFLSLCRPAYVIITNLFEYTQKSRELIAIFVSLAVYYVDNCHIQIRNCMPTPIIGGMPASLPCWVCRVYPQTVCRPPCLAIFILNCMPAPLPCHLHIKLYASPLALPSAY